MKETALEIFNLIFVISIAMPCFGQGVDLNKLRLPDGFSISVYAEVENPRQQAWGMRIPFMLVAYGRFGL